MDAGIDDNLILIRECTDKLIANIIIVHNGNLHCWSSLFHQHIININISKQNFL